MSKLVAGEQDRTLGEARNTHLVGVSDSKRFKDRQKDTRNYFDRRNMAKANKNLTREAKTLNGIS